MATLLNINRLKLLKFSKIGLVVTAIPLTVAFLTFKQVSQPKAAAPANLVTINGSITYQKMDGFGSSQRVFDDPHLTNTFDPVTGKSAVIVPATDQNTIMDNLYKDLKFTRLRPSVAGDPDQSGGLLEPVNDNSDPEITDLTKFTFAWKKNDAHIEYVKQLIPRGLSTYFVSPLNIEPWMRDPLISDYANVPEYVEWAMAILRRWRQQGVEMQYYSIVNEPGYTPNLSGEFLRDVIKALGPKLQAEGFTTKIIVPDDINATEAYKRAQIVLSDPLARPYVGALATHLYGAPEANLYSLTDLDNLKTLAKTYNLPLWMTEFWWSDPMGWADLMHTLISTYDISAIDYLWGFFGHWTGVADKLISINSTGNTYLGFVLTKNYYITGQYSRFVKPGALRIDVSSSEPTIKVTAFKNPDGTITIVALNRGTGQKTVDFSLSNLSVTSFPTVYQTSDTKNWAPLPSVTVSSGTFKATLKPATATTFTNSP